MIGWKASSMKKALLLLIAISGTIVLIINFRCKDVSDENNSRRSVKKAKRSRTGEACPRAALCGSTNESVDLHLETMHIDTLKLLFHGLVTSVEFNCTTTKLFGRIGEGNYKICMNSTSIIPKPGNCLIYSYGISHDWSFDEDFAAYGCEVHSFDPSIGKGDHMHGPNISFHNLGLQGIDFTGGNGWKYQKFSTTRKSLGHENRLIDVVKIDAEGAEWPFLRSVLVDDMDQLLTVKQLIFEFHTPSGGARAMTNADFAEVIQYLLELRRLGFLVYMNLLNNNCCANFTPLMPTGIAEKCCHETKYVNSRFLR